MVQRGLQEPGRPAGNWCIITLEDTFLPNTEKGTGSNRVAILLSYATSGVTIKCRAYEMDGVAGRSQICYP